jgi:hypothetical protein
MTQYRTFSEGQYRGVINPSSNLKMRHGHRTNQFVEDIELTSLGFNGTENVDWANIKKEDYVSTGIRFREGVRNSNYVIDAEITPHGFNGVENTDWENIAPISTLLRDGNTLAWYDAFDLATITKNESNVVTRINDRLGSGRDLLTGSCGWNSARGLTFNGVDQYLKSAAWTANQPIMVYIVLKVREWQTGRALLDGFAYNTARLYEDGGTDGYTLFLRMSAGGTMSNLNRGLSVNAWGVVKLLFKGADSFMKVDDNPITDPANIMYDGPMFGDFGSGNAGGFTLGSKGGVTRVDFANIDVAEIIIRKVQENVNDEALINSYLRRKNIAPHAFDNGKFIMTWDGDVDDIYDGGYAPCLEYGIRSTLYLQASALTDGSDNGNITWPEVAIMAANGFEIQEHGYDHDQFILFTEEELIQNLVDMDTAITAHGYPLPRHVASPYGFTNIAVREVISRYKDTLRGVEQHQLLGKITDPYSLPAIGLGAVTNSGAGLQYILDHIEYARIHKSALILYCHGADLNSGTTPESLRTIFAAVIAAGLDNIWISELYNLLEAEHI